VSATPFRVGLVGLGKQATAHHLPAIASLFDDGVILGGVAELATDDAKAALRDIRPADQVETWRQRGYVTTPEAASAVRTAPVFTDLPELLANTELDAVIVATPPATHADVTIAALEAGLPALVEKPVAPTETEAQRIADANPDGLTVAVASSFPHSLDAAALLAVFGKPSGMEIIWRRHDGIPDAAHFWNSRTSGVAPDLFPHMLRVGAHLLPTTPTRLRYAGSNKRGYSLHGHTFTGHDTATAFFETAEDIVIRLHASWADMAPGDEDFTVRWSWDDGRRAEIPVIAQKSDTHRPTAEAYRAVFRNENEGGGLVLGPIPGTYAQAMVAQLRDFRHAATTKATPVVSLADAIADTRVIGRMLHTFGTNWTDLTTPTD
jgi:predicted dehydrogenase